MLHVGKEKKKDGLGVYTKFSLSRVQCS